MIELNNKYHGKYCVCCGRKSLTIWKKLQAQEKVDMPGTIGENKKEWKGHTVYRNNDYFYDTNNLLYCEECGTELAEEDIKTVWEGRGEGHGSEEIITGYECHECGNKEEM
jgi:hypothetical protein